MSEWAEGLDAAQRQAVEHGEGPLVIAAGAGTGKTRVLTARVARLLGAGVPPERVLLLTFTRRAAAAMTGRAAELCEDPSAGQRIWSGTFHAVAHRVVSEHAHHLGLREVTVLDPQDVVDLLDLMRAEHGLSGTQSRLPTSQTLADIGSRAVNTATPTSEVIAEQFPWCLDHVPAINELLRAFTARKRERGLLDFDDLLHHWRALLADPAVGLRLRSRWDWVLVDEYQDVNQVQVDIVRSLRPDGTGLTVVGDDAQAVYGFRGAVAGHLQSLAAAYPDSTTVRLERNFRSSQQVLDLANVARPGDLPIRLVADRDVHPGLPRLHECANADDEASRVAATVLEAHGEGTPLRNQAVLMRTGVHSAQLEIELKVRNIPFMKYGGIGYLETAHVRDLLAAFRLTTNPSDEVAWYRLLTRHRSIGRAHGRSLAGLLADAAAGSPTTPTGALAEALAAAPDRAATALGRTFDAMARAQAADNVAETVEACHAAVEPLLRQHYTDWQRRIDDVARLAEAASRQVDLRVFVADQAIDPVSVVGDWAKRPHLDEDYLTLSTIHSAKGLEWDSVHLIRACDGALPSDMALTSRAGLEEEQRLFYVALTRARDHLHLYVPSRLPTHPTSLHARHVLTKPSRFLTPEAKACLHVEERNALGAVTRGEAQPAAARVQVESLDHLFS